MLSQTLFLTPLTICAKHFFCHSFCPLNLPSFLSIHSFCICEVCLEYFSFSLLFFLNFYWTVAALQCCVSFCYTAK